MNLLYKLESEVGCPDWKAATYGLRLPKNKTKNKTKQKTTWICCSGHVKFSRNEQEDRLGSTTHIITGLQPCKIEALRGLKNIQNKDSQEHHSSDSIDKRKVGKGSVRRSILRGQSVKPTNCGTFPRVTLGKLLRRGGRV